MKDGWAVRRLGEVCGINSTLVDPTSSAFRDLPHVGGANIASGSGELDHVISAKEEGLTSGKYIFDESTVLYSKIRPYLKKVARPRFQGLCSADIYPLTPDPAQMTRDYLFWLLLSEDFSDYAISGSARAGMPKVNRVHLFNYSAPVPPLAEQERIVRILDEALSAIGNASLKSEGATLRMAEMHESVRNEHFENLRAQSPGKPLSALCESISTGPFGSLLHKSDYHPDGIPLVNPSNLRDGLIAADGIKRVAPAKAKELARYQLRSGDVVVARRGEIGRCAVVQHDQTGWMCGTGCFIVHPGAEVLSEYLCTLIGSGPYRAVLQESSGGATMSNLSNKALAELLVSIPDMPAQRSFISAKKRLEEKIDRATAITAVKAKRLNELRTSLLHQAFTGQL